jgi:hypothetical protein
MRLPSWLSVSLVILISLVWAVNFTAGIFVSSYHPPDSINLVFSSMITTLLLTRHKSDDETAQRRNRELDDDDD